MNNWFKGKLLTEKFGVVLIWTSLLVFFVATITFLIFGDWSFSTTLCEEKVGQYGDFIGGVVGSLLALSASVLYYIALREQQKDVKINQESLNKQIQEFANQVEEQRLSREIYKSQLKTMKLQQFESSFFSYFAIYQSISNDIFKNQQNSIIDRLREAICRNINQDVKIETLSHANSIAQETYLNFFVIYENQLSYYFRTLYRLIKQIDSSPLLSEQDKWYYSKIIRSQMSTDELYLNYYNSFSPFSTKNRALLYKYNFFKHFSSFSKTEIKQLNNINNDVCAQLIIFSQIITPQIIKYINSICDNINVDVYETEITMFKCQLKIEHRINDICFNIYHDSMSSVPDNFHNIIAHYLEDLLFLSSYKNPSKAIYATQSVDTITRKNVYSFSVPTELISRLIDDPTYEK